MSQTNPSTHVTPWRGFTLLEVGIALVILSLLIVVAVPGLGALSGAQLKQETGLMAGVIRDTFARAALLGRSMRIVFDMQKRAYWVEESAVVARLHQKKLEADHDGKAKLDAVDERLEGVDAATQDEGDLAKLNLLSPPAFKPVEGEDGKPHELPTDVHFKSIWAEHLDDPVKGGQVGLYFFPGGFTEEALITLTDDEQGERTLTVWVGALTGEVSIESEEPRVPRLEED